MGTKFLESHHFSGHCITGSGSPVVTNLVNMIVIGKIRPDAPLCSVVVDLPVEIIHSWCVPRRPNAIKPLNFVSLNLTAENPLINVSIQSKIPPRFSTYRWIWLRFGTNLSTPRLHTTFISCRSPESKNGNCRNSFEFHIC